MDLRQVVVIGAGGHAKEVCSYIEGLNISLVGLIDDNKPPGPYAGSSILGDFKTLGKLLEDGASPIGYLTAVGDNNSRQFLVDRAASLGAGLLAPWTLIHARAHVGTGVTVGVGTCLAPGSIVTTDASIGRHCILNVNVSVSHDAIVGDFCNLNPGAVICGDVSLGQGCYVGAGAIVKEKVSVGEGTVIGAGAVVVRDIPPGVTAVGVPARVIKSND